MENKEKTDLQISIEILQEELKKDKSEGSYYYSWQANIAMAMVDAINDDAILGDFTSDKELYTTCNKAAKNFLDNLIG